MAFVKVLTLNLHQEEDVPRICLYRNSYKIKETSPLGNSKVKFHTLILLIAFLPSLQ